MKKALLLSALLLTGCATVPVGGVGVCVIACEFKFTPAQTTAEKAGALAGDLISGLLAKKAK